MNILITVSTYYPKKDGVSKVTQYVAEGLAQKGNNVTVITTNQNEKVNLEQHNGVVIRRVNLYTRCGFYFGNKKDYRRIIEDETKKCDVMINVCTQNAFTDVILKNIDSYKCKKVLYMHGMFDFRFHTLDFSSFSSIINKFWKEVRWFVYYFFNGKYFKKYDIVTQLHEKDYANIFFEKKYRIKSSIIENAADDEFFCVKEKKGFKKPFDRYIIYVANYDDRKNQKLVIDEFFKSKIDKEIGLVLIGSCKNNYYNMLQKRICTLRQIYKLRNDEKPILLLHDVERKFVSQYVSKAILYVMTSKWEAYPISIVESMACGIPFISTDVGVVKYFIGGIVCNKNDIKFWIEKIVNNEKMRNEMSKMCALYAKSNFMIEDKIDILEKLIK